MNISFTEKQEKFIKQMVESGDFQNASEVVRAALRFYQQQRELKIEALRREIDKAWDGPFLDYSHGELFEKVIKKWDDQDAQS